MKKHLWLGGALLAAGFASAQSALACPTTSFAITNGTGAPPVVTGSEVRFNATGLSPTLEMRVDNHPYQIFNVVDTPGTVFLASGGLPITTGYGSHTLWSSFDGCTINFTNVPPEPPPVKYDTPTLSDANSGFACPYAALSWTSSTGATTYEIWRRQLKPTIEPNMNQVWSGVANFKSILQYAGQSYVYAVRACGPDKDCSDLSNFRTVKYGTCP